MATNPLALSDEDFLNQAPPSGESGSATDEQVVNQETPGETPAEPQKQEEKPAEAEPAKPEGQVDPAPSGSEAKPETPAEKPEEKPAEGAFAAETKPGETPADKADKPAQAEGDKPPEQAAETPPNFEAMYQQIMAPFTANGKKIELKSPEEAIQLMQMGANYTRKMQEMAPNRKLLTMLGNNELLDESKLSFLISLDKGDPEAIKKLLVDKGIDPLDIDTKSESAYREGSYAVSDEEERFTTRLDELSSTDEGKATLATLNGWDQASKDMLWQQPDVMAIIHAQKQAGIYDRIANEIDRRKTLGTLATSTPFIEAYKNVGDELHAAGHFNDLKSGNQQPDPNANKTVDTPPAGTPPAVVVQDRVVAPKADVDNGAKADAASPSRTSSGKAAEVKNFLAMSDEDFLKSERFRGQV